MPMVMATFEAEQTTTVAIGVRIRAQLSWNVEQAFATAIAIVGGSQQHERNDDSRPRTEQSCDDAGEARECDWSKLGQIEGIDDHRDKSAVVTRSKCLNSRPSPSGTGRVAGICRRIRLMD